MEIIVAKTAGFCFGVDQAIKTAYASIGDRPIYTYGPIIHNEQVVEELNEKGVSVIHNLEEFEHKPIGDLIIRSHGIGESDFNNIENKGFHIIDATCPYVKRIHKIVKDASEQGHKIIIIGNPNHPEVIGIKGWSLREVTIVENLEDVDNLVGYKNETFCLVTQTTFNYLLYKKIVNKLHNMNFRVMIYETICSATQERQREAIDLASRATQMIVIGGKHSSNTQKLYYICKSICDRTYHIETAKDLVLNVFDDNDIIGITAGASTPKNIIEEVILNVRRTKL